MVQGKLVCCEWCMFFYFHNVERVSFTGLVGASRNVRTALTPTKHDGRAVLFAVVELLVSTCSCMCAYVNNIQLVPLAFLKLSWAKGKQLDALFLPPLTGTVMSSDTFCVTELKSSNTTVGSQCYFTYYQPSVKYFCIFSDCFFCWKSWESVAS